MTASPTYLTIPLSPELATRAEVLVMGLRQWRVRQALEAYRQGEGTLAYAAQRDHSSDRPPGLRFWPDSQN